MWTHDTLAEDLAARERGRKRMALTNTTIGKSSCRPDVWSAKPSLRIQDAAPIVFEVKVSRPDFQADIRSEKWKAYGDLCSQFAFAAPAGLLRRADIPAPAGLLERHATQWRWAKAPMATGAVLDPLVGWHLAVKAFYVQPVSGRYAVQVYEVRRRAIDQLSAEIGQLMRAGEGGRRDARWLLNSLYKARDLSTEMATLAEQVALANLLPGKGRTLQPRGYGSLDVIAQRLTSLLMNMPARLREIGLDDLADEIADAVHEAKKEQCS